MYSNRTAVAVSPGHAQNNLPLPISIDITIYCRITCIVRGTRCCSLREKESFRDVIDSQVFRSSTPPVKHTGSSQFQEEPLYREGSNSLPMEGSNSFPWKDQTLYDDKVICQEYCFSWDLSKPKSRKYIKNHVYNSDAREKEKDF